LYAKKCEERKFSENQVQKESSGKSRFRNKDQGKEGSKIKFKEKQVQRGI
jgi:hypothetical protein